MWHLLVPSALHYPTSTALDNGADLIGAYLDGEISLAKAAELLGSHPVQLRKKFLEKGIPVRFGAESKEELMAEAAAARAMREGPAAK